MNIASAFQTTFQAVFHILLLGALGFVLVRRSVVSQKGIDSINKLVICVILPVFIFIQLIEKFDFAIYKNWWVLPLLSFAITASGLFLGWIFLKLTKLSVDKKEFLGLMAFQNSGYLPLVLVGNILPLSLAKEMYILIFLFLIGFNSTVWSVGIPLLKDKEGTSKNHRLFEIFSPPVLGVLAAFVIILLKLEAAVPFAIIAPLKSLGKCLFPLAIFVVGGNLAQIKLAKIVNKRALCDVILLKQFLFPAVALFILFHLRLGFLLNLLILLETAMPPAVSLSVISRHYRKQDVLISQGIFFGHLVSLISIPLFLTLFWIISS